MDKPIKWAARLDHVREVTLRGRADLAYWTAHLAPQDLAPLPRDGRAEILLIAADATFHGVRFRELSVSVVVTPPDAPTDPGESAYLVQAFNSVRFFAWCERTFFSTPYAHADVHVSADPPASIELLKNGQTLFRATMQLPPDAPAHPPPRSLGGWNGRVFLPRSPRGAGRFFHACIEGATETHPFHERDSLTLKPSPAASVFQSLLDSHFAPTDWQLRPDASHAKSKTYSHQGAHA